MQLNKSETITNFKIKVHRYSTFSKVIKTYFTRMVFEQAVNNEEWRKIILKTTIVYLGCRGD